MTGREARPLFPEPAQNHAFFDDKVLTPRKANAYIAPTRGRRRLEAALRFTLGSLDADRDGIRPWRMSRLRGRSTKVG